MGYGLDVSAALVYLLLYWAALLSSEVSALRFVDGIRDYGHDLHIGFET